MAMKRAIGQLYRMGYAKPNARLVGIDTMGNKYYEDKTQIYQRHRWVEYAKDGFRERDASQVRALCSGRPFLPAAALRGRGPVRRARRPRGGRIRCASAASADLGIIIL